jgi:hypothetical protein
MKSGKIDETTSNSATDEESEEESDEKVEESSEEEDSKEAESIELPKSKPKALTDHNHNKSVR